MKSQGRAIAQSDSRASRTASPCGFDLIQERCKHRSRKQTVWRLPSAPLGSALPGLQDLSDLPYNGPTDERPGPQLGAGLWITRAKSLAAAMGEDVVPAGIALRDAVTRL